YVIRLLKYPWANLLVIRRYSNTNKQSTYTDNIIQSGCLGLLRTTGPFYNTIKIS
ncbi:phage terminase large subunit, partial [Burkholderia cenocepacia]|nr:phage terminase large subunit [Burkholderia cenocepacia]